MAYYNLMPAILEMPWLQPLPQLLTMSATSAVVPPPLRLLPLLLFPLLLSTVSELQRSEVLLKRNAFNNGTMPHHQRVHELHHLQHKLQLLRSHLSSVAAQLS